MTASSQPMEVISIGVPNPMFEGAINLYVLPGDPLTVIDTGIGTPEALAAIHEGFARHGLRVEDISQIVLTHKHADHIGLAHDLRELSGATVYIHEDDWDGVVDLDHRHSEFVPLVKQKLRELHTPEEEIEALAKFLGHGKRFAKQTEAEKLHHGQTLQVSGQPLEVIHTPGHTQGSISLSFGNYLFSGDHVLPTISPNIGAGELRRRGMMQRFLDSLDRVAAYQSDDLVALPGHGAPFNNLAERCEQLRAHHGAREQAILAILRSGGPKTVYEVARALWPKLPGYHLVLGTAEVNAHLEKALADNTVTETEGRFRAA